MLTVAASAAMPALSGVRSVFTGTGNLINPNGARRAAWRVPTYLGCGGPSRTAAFPAIPGC